MPNAKQHTPALMIDDELRADADADCYQVSLWTASFIRSAAFSAIMITAAFG